MKKDYRELVITGKGEIYKIEQFVEEICAYHNINNEYFGNILLATTEAAEILLSVNDREREGVVTVKFDRNHKGLVFKLNSGNGTSENEESQDILDQEIRKHKLGKDIFIIKALTDEIKISVNAKAITLVFYVSSMNYEKSLERINKLKEYWVAKEGVIHRK
jgi:hypothetical protein